MVLQVLPGSGLRYDMTAPVNTPPPFLSKVARMSSMHLIKLWNDQPKSAKWLCNCSINALSLHKLYQKDEAQRALQSTLPMMQDIFWN